MLQKLVPTSLFSEWVARERRLCYALRMQENHGNFRDVFLYGKAAVQAAFKFRRIAIEKLFLTAENHKTFSELCSWLASERRPYESQDFNALSRMVGSTKHEGVVAITRRPVPASIRPVMRDEWHAAGEKILFIDGVEDAAELARLAHVAAVCGISRLIVSENAVPALMSADAWSLSAGALDVLKIYSTESMAGLLRMMREKFFIVGAVREGGRRIDYSKPIAFPGRPVALYVSGDSNGVSADLVARFDYLLHIAEPTDAFFRYSPSEIATHLLPWLNAKIKKPGEGFFARKKERSGKRN